MSMYRGILHLLLPPTFQAGCRSTAVWWTQAKPSAWVKCTIFALSLRCLCLEPKTTLPLSASIHRESERNCLINSGSRVWMYSLSPCSPKNGLHCPVPPVREGSELSPLGIYQTVSEQLFGDSAFPACLPDPSDEQRQTHYRDQKAQNLHAQTSHEG